MLTKIYQGRETANTLFRLILQRCPSLIPYVSRPGFVNQTSLPYAIGFVETEQTLEQLYKELGSEISWAETREHYLNQGPITPISATRLAALTTMVYNK